MLCSLPDVLAGVEKMVALTFLVAEIVAAAAAADQLSCRSVVVLPVLLCLFCFVICFPASLLVDFSIFCSATLLFGKFVCCSAL